MRNNTDSKPVLSESCLHELLQAGGNLLWFCLSETGLILRITANVEDLLGYQVETVVGKPFKRLLCPTDGETVLNVIADRKQDAQPFSIVARLLMNGGQWRWFQLTCKGGPQVSILARSVNELVDVNERLKAATKEMDELFFAMNQHNIVAITDVTGCITRVNQKFCEISQYKEHELLGRNHRILKSGKHTLAFFREMWRTIACGKVWHGEICNKAKDGTFYWVDTTIIPFLGMDQKPYQYLSIRADITARVLAMQALESARAQAEAASVAKSAFLAIISHELRTPLNPVMGYAQLIAELCEDGELKGYAHSIHRSAEQLLKLINEILEFSKMDQGKFKFTPQVVYLHEFSLQQVLILKTSGKLKVGVQLRVQNNLPGATSVLSEPYHLQKLVQHLLENAAKFTQEGEIVIGLHPVAGGGSFDVTVKDTGIGIPKEALEDVFQPFFQVDHSSSRKFPGTGLGLALARGLAQKLNVQLNLDSREGEGTTVSLRIPRFIPMERVAVFEAEHDVSSFRRLEGETIQVLVVARAHGPVCGMDELFGAFTIHPMVVADVTQACQEIKVRQFGVVLVDGGLELSGGAIRDGLRRAGFEATLWIGLMEHWDQCDVSRLKSLGYDDAFVLPLSLEQLDLAMALLAGGG